MSKRKPLSLPLSLRALPLSLWIGSLWLGTVAGSLCYAQERTVYEGVVSWQKKTIGTAILLEKTGDKVTGWIRLQNFFPIEAGKITDGAMEFQARGNSYRLDPRRNRIVYSGPDGSGDRLVTPLTHLVGPLKELLEETQDSPKIATIDVDGRMWQLGYGRPSLWKWSGAPFERFERLEELLGKEVSVWASNADVRRGDMVVIEEPKGMDIPLKAPKKPKEDKKDDKKDSADKKQN